MPPGFFFAQGDSRGPGQAAPDRAGTNPLKFTALTAPVVRTPRPSVRAATPPESRAEQLGLLEDEHRGRQLGGSQDPGEVFVRIGPTRQVPAEARAVQVDDGNRSRAHELAEVRHPAKIE